MALRDGYVHEPPGNAAIRDGYHHSPPGNAALRDGYDNVLSVGPGAIRLSRAEITGTALTLYFNVALDTGSVPAAGTSP